MADQHKFRNVAPQAGTDSSDSFAETSPSAATPTRDRLQRLAALVVSGEITRTSAEREFLSEDRQHFEAIVWRLQRDRLVRFIALQIAWDIHSERDHKQREREHCGNGDRRPTSE